MRRSWEPGRHPHAAIRFYIGPFRVPRLVYNVWRVAFRVKDES